MANCQWVEHRGSRILVVTYTGCRTDDEMLAVLADQGRLIVAEGGKVRVLHDYREVALGEQFLKESFRLGKERRPILIERAAIVGLTGFKKALFHSYRMASDDAVSQAFESIDTALDWLAR